MEIAPAAKVAVVSLSRESLASCLLLPLAEHLLKEVIGESCIMGQYSVTLLAESRSLMVIFVI